MVFFNDLTIICAGVVQGCAEGAYYLPVKLAGI